jgi:hypothetical protein
MGDFDLLVPPAQAVAAAAVLRRAGWAPRHALTPAFMSVKHAVPFDGEHGEECDLHWRVFEEPTDARADAECWAAATTVTFQGTRFRVLCPADQLLHTCVHGAKWAPTAGIRWIADAALLVREARIDWPRLVAQARGRRFTLRARQTLCYLATTMGAAIPADLLAELASRPPSVLERIEHRLKSREHPRLGELPNYWCHYLRSRPAGPPRPLGFARYLQRAWDLDSLAQVPGRALALASGRLSPAARRLAS